VRGRLAVAIAVAVAALAGIVAILGYVSTRGSGSGRVPFTTATRAGAPFGEFDEGRVALGSRCLRVLLATSEHQRVQGLRNITSLGPYDGMLFAFPSDTNARFTMANTPLPLDIIWFAADGSPVDTARMTPCPNGTDATCPTYAAKHRYRYGLERVAPSSGGGRLGPCAS